MVALHDQFYLRPSAKSVVKKSLFAFLSDFALEIIINFPQRNTRSRQVLCIDGWWQMSIKSTTVDR